MKTYIKHTQVKKLKNVGSFHTRIQKGNHSIIIETCDEAVITTYKALMKNNPDVYKCYVTEEVPTRYFFEVPADLVRNKLHVR